MPFLRNLRFLSVFSFSFYIIVLAWTNPAFPADETMPPQHHEREAFARDFAQTVINIIRDPKTSYGHRQDILRKAFGNSVDIDWIAKFVLGRTWKYATDEQRDTYLSLYRRFLTETYVNDFAENPDKGIYDIKVSSVNDEKKDTFIVSTYMKLMDKSNLKVDYLIYEKDNSHKVRDIVIENVSLISSHRAEFSELANDQGIDGVIKKLEQSLNEYKYKVRLSMK